MKVPTHQQALKSLQKLAAITDRDLKEGVESFGTVTGGLFEVVYEEPTVVGMLDTEVYERKQERRLIVQPTTKANVVELWFQDGAGYEGLIGTLTFARRGQRGVRG